MTCSTYVSSLLVLTVAGLAGCSSEPSAKTSKQTTAPDKIRGKAQILLTETTAADAAMNAGGPSVYLVDGLTRYRLFFNNKAFPVEAGHEYVAEGVIAQKAIDAIGDPDQGKNGYPLASSCERVVKMAWPGLAMDVTDLHAEVLCTRIKRYPARPIFLVTKLHPVTDKEKDKETGKAARAGGEEVAEVTVPAEKQSALLIEGPTVETAPLWSPAGGTVRCKLVIDEEGRVYDLETGVQLC